MTRSELGLGDLAGLLKHLVSRIPGAETAILFTANGQATASWGGVFPRTARDMSLLASTLRTLTEATERHRRLGPVWRTIVALDHQLFALAPAGPDAVLGVTLSGRATLDSVLVDTATAAEHARRVLAAHEVHVDAPTSSMPMRPVAALQRRKHRRSVEPHPSCHPAGGTAPPPDRSTVGRHAARTGGPPLTACDPNHPSDDQLERMLVRLRTL